MKKCGHCGEFKDEIKFWKDKNNIDGLTCWCKDCYRIRRGNIKNINNPSTIIKKCYICECELIIGQNIYVSQFNNKHYICNDCSEKERKLNWGKRYKRIKEYDRNNILGTTNKEGKQIRIRCKKRKHTLVCELCDKEVIKTVYHHWNKPKNGIWVCLKCHWFVEGIESGLTKETIDKYIILKTKIENGEI